MLTEEIQAAKRKENEENLQRFQREVRRRVAERAHLIRKRQVIVETDVCSLDEDGGDWVIFGQMSSQNNKTKLCFRRSERSSITIAKSGPTMYLLGRPWCLLEVLHNTI